MQKKKQYIIKNTMKSGALYGLSIISPPLIYSLIINDNYYNYNLIIQIGAIIYTINDTVAIYTEIKQFQCKESIM